MDRVKLSNDDTIHINLEGSINTEIAKQVLSQLDIIRSQLYADHKRILISVFLDTKGDSDKGARDQWIDALHKKQYDKMAFWGGNIFTESALRFLLRISGITENIAIFRSESEAINWLQKT